MRAPHQRLVDRRWLVAIGLLVGASGASAIVGLGNLASADQPAMTVSAATTTIPAAADTTTVPAATTTTTASATTTPPGSVCASKPNALLPAADFGPNMTVLATVSARGLFSMSEPVGGASRSAMAAMQWFQSLEAQQSNLPSSFAVLSTSPLVSTEPSTVFQITETIQSFPTAAQASTFAETFRTANIPAARVKVGVAFTATT